MYSRKLINIALLTGMVLAGPFTAWADGAILYLSPAAVTKSVGQTFSVAVRVDSGGASINAVEGSLAFDPELLQVVSLSKAGSVFSIWPSEPAYSNAAGSVTFAGGLPSPGFNGASGLAFTLTIKVIKASNTTFRFVSGAALANDGSGTNILASTKSTTVSAPASTPKPSPTPVPIIVQPQPLPAQPAITSPTHPVNYLGAPDPHAWSQKNDPEFNWTSAPDALSFSFALDKDAAITPDDIPDGSVPVKLYENTEDGIWYFHLRARNAAGWSPTAHYEIHVDATPPESFSIAITGQRSSTNPRPELAFTTKDAGSGMDHYSLSVAGSDPRRLTPDEASHAVKLDALSPGTYATRVIAYDRAGNSTEAFAEFTVLALEPPVITVYSKSSAKGEAMFVEGSTLPHATVVLTFTHAKTSEELQHEVTADADGRWSYMGGERMGAGEWRIAAKSLDATGAVSTESPPIVTEVLPTAIAVGPYRITYASAYGTGALFLSLAALIILLILLRYRKKFRTLHRDIMKEVREAEEAVRVGFQTLRGDVLEELRTIDALQATRDLTAEEVERRNKLLKDLAFIEFQVSKEVRDIAQILEHRDDVAPSPSLPEPPPPAA